MVDVKKYRKHYVTEKAAENYIRQGKCPVCMMLLTSLYHDNCPYLDDTAKIVDKNLDPIV